MIPFPASVGLPKTPSQANRLFAQAARLAKFGAWECDVGTQELTWTDGVYDLFELPRSAPLRRASILELYVDQSREALERMRAEAIRTGEGFVLDTEIRTWRGKARWMRLSVDTARENGPHGAVVRLFGAKQDITDERAAWDRVRHLAERDYITGLANRRLFDARVRAILDNPASHERVAAFALIDIDHFKRINDRHGHAAGDECLRQTAMRLSETFGSALLLARIGGDEFAVLLRAPLGPVRLREMLQRGAEAAGKPIYWDGRRIEIGVSVGATLLGRADRRQLSALFANADAALYAAKAAGRRTVRIFGDDPSGLLTPSRSRQVSRTRIDQFAGG